MNKFDIQKKQYSFPYHYLVNLKEFNNKKKLSWGLSYFAYMKYTINYIERLQFNSLLDVGCGDGKLLFELSDKYTNRKFVGVDMAKPAILLAKGINHSKDNCDFKCDDVGNLNKEYDVVVLNEVIEHIPDNNLDSFINKSINKLKKGGDMLVTVPSDNFPVLEKHYRHYNIDMLKEQFSDLKIKKIDYLYKHNLFIKYFVAIWNKFCLPSFVLEYIGNQFIFQASKKIVNIYSYILKNNYKFYV